MNFTLRTEALVLSCSIAYTCSVYGFSMSICRRTSLELIHNLSINPYVATSLISIPLPVIADVDVSPLSTPISASWRAVDGINSLGSEKNFVSFDKSAYEAMVNDQSRTPLFEQAIIRRLNSAEGGPTSQVVLDIGTGPFALFAVMAAKNGAGRVYAIEASKEAAASARETISRLGYDHTITILEGFSSDVSLPEGIKADFVIAEVVGSVASEEGAYATIFDAHKRFLKSPNDPRSWIPNRIQTFAAPASYTLHNLFLPPAFDWTKLNGEPVRFNCRDEGLQLISDPVLLEDIAFADIGEDNNGVRKKVITFVANEERIRRNSQSFKEEFKRGRLPKEEGAELAMKTAQSISGIALWPRLILDDTTQVDSRHYPDGGHQKSHWQTVLPIMNPTPVFVQGGDQIMVEFLFDTPVEVTRPPSYRISGKVINLST